MTCATLLMPGPCFVAPKALCCFPAPPALCCFPAPNTICCFQAKPEPNAMSWGTQANCCNPCQSCCIGECAKKTTERKPVMIDWTAALICGGDKMDHETTYKLKSVVHEITLDDGTALPGNPNDLVIALDGNADPMEGVRDSVPVSFAYVELGEDKADYRINACATFRDCDGMEMVLCNCINVSVRDC